jgi:hypothetical protein
MQGWTFVFVLAAAWAGAASFMVGYSARRRVDYLILLVGSIALLEPIVNSYGGDVSRYLPASLFSAGEDGKNQIVLASAATALFSAPVLAAACLLLYRRLRRVFGLDTGAPQ